MFRRFGVHKFIPLDLHVSYHKGCAVILSLLSLVHTIVHLINLDLNVITSPVLNINNYTYTQWLTTTSPKKLGTFPGFGYPTGLSLIIVLGKSKFFKTNIILIDFPALMLLGALPVIRRRGFFEMFYWTHLNYITFSVLYCLHSPTGLLWFLVPGAVFLLYKLTVFVRLCLGLRSSVALECTALQSKVTKLVMERRFSFHAGDYVFINIPQISR